MITFLKEKVSNGPEIKKLLYKSWTSIYSDFYTPEAIDSVASDWHLIKLLTKQIKDPSVFFRVAKVENKIIAMYNASLKDNGKVINVQRMHIDPDYHRQGIGTSLMKEVVKAFSKTKNIDLEVEKQNHKAIVFYKKTWFQKSRGERI